MIGPFLGTTAVEVDTVHERVCKRKGKALEEQGVDELCEWVLTNEFCCVGEEFGVVGCELFREPLRSVS